MSEEKLVPKLRFSGFDDEWEHNLGKDIFNIMGGGSFKSEDSCHEGVKWLKIANVGINQIKTDELSYLPLNFLDLYKQYIIKKNDVILALTRPLLDHKLKITIVNNEFDNSLLNQRVGKITVKNNNILKFIYYYLQLPYSIYYLESMISGTDPPNLSNKDLLNIPMNIPTFQEQKKISEFISKIEIKVNLLEKKYDAYYNFKKYLMQQIFAQKLRFADDTDWVTVTVDNLFDNITDYVAAGSFADIRKNVTYLKNPDYAQLIRTADLKSNFTNGDFVYVDKHAFEYLWRVNLDNPCIILPNIGNVGEVYYVEPMGLPYNNNVLAPNAILLKSNENIKFKYYLLESQYFKNQLDIINEAGGRGKFNKTNLKKIKIKVPNNNLEKEKISNCLSSVDNKLKYFNIQLIETQNFKKGLLQQMFV